MSKVNSEQEVSWQPPTLNVGYGSLGKPGFIPTRPGSSETWNANMQRIMNGIQATSSGKTSREGGLVGQEEKMDYEFVYAPPPTMHNPSEHPPMLVRRQKQNNTFVMDEHNEDGSKRSKIEQDMEMVD